MTRGATVRFISKPVKALKDFVVKRQLSHVCIFYPCITVCLVSLNHSLPCILVSQFALYPCITVCLLSLYHSFPCILVSHFALYPCITVCLVSLYHSLPCILVSQFALYPFITVYLVYIPFILRKHTHCT